MPSIRNAVIEDLPELVSILNPFIENTFVTFDTEPYTPETRMPWFHQFQTKGRHQCLVLCEGSDILGYANSGPLRPKRAYDTSVEVSIYLHEKARGNGFGTELYRHLFERLANEDVHRAHALITLPNQGSVALHERMGFYEVGTLHEAGRKFGQYHSVFWMERRFD